MKIEIYYEDYALQGSCDYPCKLVIANSEQEFWDELNNKNKYLLCRIPGNKNKKVYLNKDRIIEIWIYNVMEDKEWNY